MIAMTMATMGRRMKNFDIEITSLPEFVGMAVAARRGRDAELTGAPSRKLLQIVGNHQRAGGNAGVDKPVGADLRAQLSQWPRGPCRRLPAT